MSGSPFRGTVSAADGLGQNDCSFSIPVRVTLPPGHYWLSVQANDPLNWYWEIRSVVSNHAALLQNPGGGSGGGCTTWSDLSACGASEPGDLVFTLLGALETVYVGTPGQPNCRGKTVSALSEQYGGDLAAAAQRLGFHSVKAMQEDIRQYRSGH